MISISSLSGFIGTSIAVIQQNLHRTVQQDNFSSHISLLVRFAFCYAVPCTSIHQRARFCQPFLPLDISGKSCRIKLAWGLSI